VPEQFDAVERAVRETLDCTIATRRAASPAQDRDLLAEVVRLADAADRPGGASADAFIRDLALLLLLAGHETVTTTLTWTFYLLAQQPDAERDLQRELDAVTGGAPPRAEDLPSLEYGEWVISEALRLYPAVWVLGQFARESCRVGGYDIPLGALVLVRPWVLHRDPRYYRDPDRFVPDRWKAGANAVPTYAYIPFSVGARRCVGTAFAWLETPLLLATIAQRWCLRLEPGQTVEPEPSHSLRPRHGLRMRLTRRRDRSGPNA
jgi:cytochrome P450